MATRRTFGRLTFGALLSTASFTAGAQAFPVRPVRLIIPFPVGGHVDRVARGISEQLSAEWGQPVLVEAKPGAASTIASAYVARSPADGYVLYVANLSALTQSGSVYPNLSYDVVKSFAAITTIDRNYSILVVRPQFQVNSVSELVGLAKAKPGKLNYGSSGQGGPIHIGTEKFKRMTGIDAVHVPFNGTAPALQAVMSGDIEFMFSDASALPLVETGRLKALAVGGNRRWSALPGIPTVSESGPSGFTLDSVEILLAPAGTPRAVIERIHDTVTKVMKKPAVTQYFRSLNVDVETSTPEEAQELIRSDFQLNAEIIRALDLKVN